MKAKKENKVYTITEMEKKRYLDTGFDIYDDEGNLTEHSPLKKISYAEHDKLLKSHERLIVAYEDLQFRHSQLIDAGAVATISEKPETEPDKEAGKGKAVKKAGE